MYYVIKHKKTKKYVSKPESYRSYTIDRQKAQEFKTREEAQKNLCIENEEVWYSFREERIIAHDNI